jgi:hypothetical protein
MMKNYKEIGEPIFNSTVHLYVNPTPKQDRRIAKKHRLREVYKESSFYTSGTLDYVVILRGAQKFKGACAYATQDHAYHEAGHISHRIEADIGMNDSSGEFVLYVQSFWAKEFIRFMQKYLA